jgi:hypothetical protein
VGLASPAMRGEEEKELTFEVGDGAMGSGMATGVRDDNGGTAVVSTPKAGSATGLARWGRGWCDGVGDGDGGQGQQWGTADNVEAEGGVSNVVGAMGSRMVRRGRGP